MTTTIQAPRVARRTASDALGFWGLAGLLGLLMFAASAPSPLYGIYAAHWHLSATTETAVFAVYAVALLAALLVVGRLSDHLGRRPVILAAVVVESAAMACFIAADSTALLFLARTLQGAATGAAIGALSAALVELSPGAGRSAQMAAMVNSAAPTIGLAVGALGTSALVQYGPIPTRLVYWLLLGGFAVGGMLVTAIREPGTRRPEALASLVPRPGVPQHARATFVRSVPCLVALWALGGFYLSLGPALAGALSSSRNLLWGGTIIFLLTGTGAVAAILGRKSGEQQAMCYGCINLALGVGITLGGIATTSVWALLFGSVVAGVGFGLAFLGVFRTLSALARPEERAGMITMIYVVSYLAFSVPVMLAGVAVTSVGLHRVAFWYAGIVALLAVVGAATSLPKVRSVRAAVKTVRIGADLPPCPGTVPLCIHGDAARDVLSVTGS